LGVDEFVAGEDVVREYSFEVDGETGDPSSWSIHVQPPVFPDGSGLAKFVVTPPDSRIEGSLGVYTFTLSTDYAEPRHVGLWAISVVAFGTGKSVVDDWVLVRGPAVAA
jgi:hypothetical protein